MLTLVAITVALGNKGDGLDTAVVAGNLRLSTVVGRLQEGQKTALGIKLIYTAQLIPTGILRLVMQVVTLPHSRGKYTVRISG